MTVFHCPRCQKRVTISPHSGDYVHRCDSRVEALDNEDVPFMGTATDYTGTTEFPTRKVSWQGVENTVFGTKADVEGANIDRYTSRGNRTKTHRTRQHLEYVENPDSIGETL